MKRFLALLLLAPAAPLAAQGSASFVVQETGRSFSSLQDAVNAIGGGSGTIVIAPGRYRQCAVQHDGDIAYVAAQPGTAVLDGVACDGKAALVLDGRRARVEGLTFQNIRVPDANGAGIRQESGDLIVRESLFRNSESGILSASDPGSTILVEQSTFSGLGRCDRGLSCAHSIYIGDYGALVVRRSRFERGRGGHYVKSRTPRVEVSDSSFDDTAGHTTNYMIDLPAGATGVIARNIFVQGRDKENYSGLIVVGAEDIKHSAAGLRIEANDASLAPGVEHGTTFLVDYTGDPLRIGANRLGARIARFERR
ncbi:MAG: hypothetical protein QOH04_2536 [Sphingomonadales bacterium]|jgi:hypothetical protein|nr:hypothetical protein [Sphingomonadales bacterium]